MFACGHTCVGKLAYASECEKIHCGWDHSLGKGFRKETS